LKLQKGRKGRQKGKNWIDLPITKLSLGKYLSTGGLARRRLEGDMIFFDDLTKKIESIFSTEFVPASFRSLLSQGRSFDQGGNVSSNTWQKISMNKRQRILRSQVNNM